MTADTNTNLFYDYQLTVFRSATSHLRLFIAGMLAGEVCPSRYTWHTTQQLRHTTLRGLRRAMMSKIAARVTQCCLCNAHLVTAEIRQAVIPPTPEVALPYPG